MAWQFPLFFLPNVEHRVETNNPPTTRASSPLQVFELRSCQTHRLALRPSLHDDAPAQQWVTA
jgi:hypothetical protein